MPTTTNYGWTTPADTDLVKDGASAIRTLGSSVDTTVKNLNPETTLGDIAYRSSTANVKTRLALGTAGQVLKVNSGATAPEWGTISSGGQTLLSTTTLTGSSVTISSISQDYKHLFVNIVGAYNSADAYLGCRINGVTSSTYQWDTIAAADGNATAQFVAEDGDSRIRIGAFGTSSTYGKALTAEIYFHRYTEVVVPKLFFRSKGYYTYNWIYTGAGVQSTAAAITSLTFLPGTGTFSGGTVYVYGVN